MKDEVFTVKLSIGEYIYKVVRSKRAKYVRIKMSSRGELSVVIPFFTKIFVAHDFVDSQKKWIEKALLKIDSGKVNQFPDSLDLKFLDEFWEVLYVEQDQRKETLILKELESLNPHKHIIEIKGNSSQLNDSSQVQKILNQWCKGKAIYVFNSMFKSLAESNGFHYNDLTIRAQKTRWGSCSSKNNISLNCKLLFMPKEVVKYVMIHELCHTIEMNHSLAFWELVEKYDPWFRENKHKLKFLECKIPL